MDDKEFDKILKEVLRDYVKDTESKPTEKVKFSEEHERKMEEIFNAVENGTLGNFKITEKTNKKDNMLMLYKRRAVPKILKVAIFVIAALIVSLTVAPNMKAWKTNDLKVYEDETGEYAWILPNDVTEVIDSDVENVGQYLDLFGYLPSECKVTSVRKTNHNLFIKLSFINGENITFRVLQDVFNFSSDNEHSGYQEFINNDVRFLYFQKEKECSFVWNYGMKKYELYGEFPYEIMIEVIENINYEKINKIF